MAAAPACAGAGVDVQDEAAHGATGLPCDYAAETWTSADETFGDKAADCGLDDVPAHAALRHQLLARREALAGLPPAEAHGLPQPVHELVG